MPIDAQYDHVMGTSNHHMSTFSLSARKKVYTRFHFEVIEPRIPIADTLDGGFLGRKPSMIEPVRGFRGKGCLAPIPG